MHFCTTCCVFGWTEHSSKSRISAITTLLVANTLIPYNTPSNVLHMNAQSPPLPLDSAAHTVAATAEAGRVGPMGTAAIAAPLAPPTLASGLVAETAHAGRVSPMGTAAFAAPLTSPMALSDTMAAAAHTETAPAKGHGSTVPTIDWAADAASPNYPTLRDMAAVTRDAGDRPQGDGKILLSRRTKSTERG